MRGQGAIRLAFARKSRHDARGLTGHAPMPTNPWWKDCAIYQIYPKSFRDGNGDGVGDLAGIVEKIDNLAELGVGALWLSPIFASPMIDNGYDVSDYKAVNPLFGTLADLDELIAAARARNMRIILDIALNHTSTQHPWFQNALAHGDKRDWYWWRKGRCGAAPNNWPSIFGGPAWTQPAGSEDYYLHLFDKSQADLNWENPAVRAAIYDSMRYWLDRGIGGFRLDVVTVISKDPELRDVTDTRTMPFYRRLAGGPRLHDFLREMRREVFSHYDCVAIGEAPGFDPARAAAVVDPLDPMLDMIYHFDLVEPQRDNTGAWDRAAFKQTFRTWDEGIGARGWNSVVISNHDLGRVVSRFGDDHNFRFESAAALLTLVLTQRATPFLYQGDELGLVNCPFDSIGELDDVWAKNYYALALQTGKTEAQAFQRALAITRDHARTPYPWNSGANLGFSDALGTWLKPNPRHAHLAAATQKADIKSVRSFAKVLIAMRAADPLWIHGDTHFVDQTPSAVFAYRRALEAQTRTVALNLSSQAQAFAAPTGAARRISNYADDGDAHALRPWEAVIF
jgi:oligo-1,6-glucosidase